MDSNQQADFWKQWGVILNYGSRLETVEGKLERTETRIDGISEWVSAMKGAWAVVGFLAVFLTGIAIKWGGAIWRGIVAHIHQSGRSAAS